MKAVCRLLISFFHFQGKLELITGVLSDSMQLEVFDSLGSSVCSLDDDTATLSSLPVADGMKLHVSTETICTVQSTHTNMLLNAWLPVCFMLTESCSTVGGRSDLLCSHL